MKKKEDKKNQIGLSVVVCTYNRDKLLPDCLNSLVNQNIGKNLFEVIVVDNNSNDKTKQVITEFSMKHPNFRYVFEPQQGLSHARNRGLKEARASYVAYIDDDARAKGDWLGQAFRIIEEKKPDIFGGPVYPIFPEGKPEWFKEEYGARGKRRETGWIERGYIIGTNIFFKRSLLEEYGGFDPELGMKGNQMAYHEETQLAFRAFKDNKKVYYSNEIIVRDIVPHIKSTLVYFLLSFYRKGYTSLGLLDRRKVSEHQKLHHLINDMMDEFNTALFHRNTQKYQYPENHIFEKLGKKMMEIGRSVHLLIEKEEKNKSSKDRNIFIFIKDFFKIILKGKQKEK